MPLIDVGKVLELANAGWPVFPVAISADPQKPDQLRKIPRIKAWGENATTDEATVRSWWGGQFYACMVGIPTGSRSGLFVIDIDIKGRRRGDHSLEALEKRLGALPKTLTVRTASGGRHYYFAWDEALAAATVRASVNKQWDGIDWRGKGGYVVGPGSLTPDDKKWAIIHQVPIVPLPPAWIQEIVRVSGVSPEPPVEPTADTETKNVEPRRPNPKRPRNKLNFGFDPEDDLDLKADEPDPIMDGKRNEELTRAGGRLRRQGATCQEIDAVLQSLNQAQCKPPLPRAEVSTIARSLTRYAPGPLPMNDLGNAARFAERYRDAIVYVPEQDQWFVWDRQRWRPESDSAMPRYIDEFVTELRIQAAAIQDPDERVRALKWAHVSGEAKRVNPMMRLARAHEFIAAPAATFNADRSKIAFQRYTLECQRDGHVAQLRHSPEDRMTKLGGASGDFSAPDPLWQAFLERSQPNPELRGYLQRAAGYSLVGGQAEKCAFILHGPPNTGKTVFVETLGRVFGEWRAVGEVSMFTGEVNKPVLAEAEGARIVTCGEIPHDRSFEAAVFKAWVGNDFLTAARKYKSPRTFKADGKLWFAGNHPPHLDTEDDASWSRLRVIPFLTSIPEHERDGQLVHKFNCDGVLAWIVDGWRLYCQHGLAVPSAIQAATEEARNTSDRLKDALDALILRTPGESLSWTSFRGVYVQWCRDMGVRPLSPIVMKQIMGHRHGLFLHRNKAGMFWRDIRLSPMGRAYAGANVAPVVDDETGKEIL